MNPKTPLFDRAIKVAFRRLTPAREDPRCLEVPDQTLIAIYAAQGVIDNGGFRYFFGSDWPGHPPYTFFSGAYRRIGAAEAAECMDQATGLFPFPRPHLAKNRRKRFMDSIPQTHRFYRLGDRVCGDGTVWQKVEQYVRENARHFWRAQQCVAADERACQAAAPSPLNAVFCGPQGVGRK